jgi:hypothetical protein
MHVIAAKAVTFYEALQPEFTVYQRAVLDNALTLANELKRSGLRLVTGGTDTHLVLVDLAFEGIGFKKISEKLDEILKRFKDNWDEQVKYLKELREEMRAGRKTEEGGLDPVRYAPFYDMLKEISLKDKFQKIKKRISKNPETFGKGATRALQDQSRRIIRLLPGHLFHSLPLEFLLMLSWHYFSAPSLSTGYVQARFFSKNIQIYFGV